MRSDYFILGWKNLKRRGLRSWLTLLGIFIGILAVVSLISLGEGLKTAVNSQFGISNTEVISVQAGGLNGFGPPGTGVVNPLNKKDLEEIERLSSVEVAIGRNIETLKAEYDRKNEFIFAATVPDGEKRKYIYEFLELEVSSGRLLEDGDDNGVLVGSDYLDEFEVGDRVTLNEKEFRIIGILEKKGSFILDGSFLINDKPLDDLVDFEDNYDLFVVKPRDKERIQETKGDIEKALRESRDVDLGEEDFEVSTPEASLETINQILGGIQIFIVLIASISIIVGAIGIVNTMTTSVLERVKEIGIMKAIGAKNSDIFFQFFIEAGLLGLVGGILGTLFGVAFSYLGVQGINSFIGSESPFQINFVLIFGALLGSFIIGSISGIAPALKAASMNPVEALRK